MVDSLNVLKHFSACCCQSKPRVSICPLLLLIIADWSSNPWLTSHTKVKSLYKVKPLSIMQMLLCKNIRTVLSDYQSAIPSLWREWSLLFFSHMKAWQLILFIFLNSEIEKQAELGSYQKCCEIIRVVPKSDNCEVIQMQRFSFLRGLSFSFQHPTSSHLCSPGCFPASGDG